MNRSRLVLPPSAGPAASAPPPQGSSVNIGVHGDRVIVQILQTLHLDSASAKELASNLSVAADAAGGFATPKPVISGLAIDPALMGA